MEAYHKFFRFMKRVSSKLSPAREGEINPREDDRFMFLEIINIVREKTRYCIHARMPGSPRTFKFSLLRDGQVFGICHNEELTLTEPTQKILREKFALYVQDSPSYFISE